MKNFLKRSIGELFSTGFSAAANPFAKVKSSTDLRRTTLEYLLNRSANQTDAPDQTTPEKRRTRR